MSTAYKNEFNGWYIVKSGRTQTGDMVLAPSTSGRERIKATASAGMPDFMRGMFTK